jgi:multidrug efflux pump
MTSVTFVLGMMPLVLAAGAGAASRRAVGTGVMGSMLTATLIGVFFTPVFYVAARRWLSRKKRESDLDDLNAAPRTAPTPTPAHGGPGGGPHDA